MNKETGINLITQERWEQLYKHNRSVQDDILYNDELQLVEAAKHLIKSFTDDPLDCLPRNWSLHIWAKMLAKPYKERLIIAGALIAAEIDRLQNQ